MGKKAFSPERIRCCGKKDNEMTESDDALMLRVAREEIKRQAAEIEYLKARLEVSAYHPYDGIVSRDATIKLQDERIAAMRELVNVRLLQRMALALEVCDSKWRETDSMLRIDLAKSITAAEFQQAEPSSPSDNAASELEADAASPDT